MMMAMMIMIMMMMLLMMMMTTMVKMRPVPRGEGTRDRRGQLDWKTEKGAAILYHACVMLIKYHISCMYHISCIMLH